MRWFNGFNSQISAKKRPFSPLWSILSPKPYRSWPLTFHIKNVCNKTWKLMKSMATKILRRRGWVRTISTTRIAEIPTTLQRHLSRSEFFPEYVHFLIFTIALLTNFHRICKERFQIGGLRNSRHWELFQETLIGIIKKDDAQLLTRTTVMLSKTDLELNFCWVKWNSNHCIFWLNGMNLVTRGSLWHWRSYCLPVCEVWIL